MRTFFIATILAFLFVARVTSSVNKAPIKTAKFVAPETRKLHKKLIDRAREFCAAIEQPVVGESKTPKLLMRDGSHLQEDHWRSHWLIEFPGQAEVKVVEETGAIVSYRRGEKWKSFALALNDQATSPPIEPILPAPAHIIPTPSRSPQEAVPTPTSVILHGRSPELIGKRAARILQATGESEPVRFFELQRERGEYEGYEWKRVWNDLSFFDAPSESHHGFQVFFDPTGTVRRLHWYLPIAVPAKMPPTKFSSNQAGKLALRTVGALHKRKDADWNARFPKHRREARQPVHVVRIEKFLVCPNAKLLSPLKTKANMAKSARVAWVCRIQSREKQGFWSQDIVYIDVETGKVIGGDRIAER